MHITIGRLTFIILNNQWDEWYPSIIKYKNLCEIDFDWFCFRITYYYGPIEKLYLN